MVSRRFGLVSFIAGLALAGIFLGRETFLVALAAAAAGVLVERALAALRTRRASLPLSAIVRRSPHRVRDDALLALAALGFARRVALPAIEQASSPADPALDTADLVTRALRSLDEPRRRGAVA